jgi:predicted porin
MIKRMGAALLFALSGSAYAQSSVTLYGILDFAVSYYNNASQGGSFIGIPTVTGELPSRWGIKGVEDVGGGYKVLFVLENGFQPGTGVLNYGGRLFGRQAYVAVSSNAYGTLTFGRQMNMTMYAQANADVIGPSLHSMAAFDAYLPNARSDNAIGYMGTFHGLTLGGTYSFGRDAAGPVGPSATNCAGQVPGDFIACRQYTALIAYDAANFGLAASYDVARGGTGALAPLNNPAYTDTHNIINAYVKVGPAKFGVGWIRRNTAAASHLQADIIFAGGTYYATPFLSLDLQGVRYLQRVEGGKGDANSTLLIGRVNYFLSKRTTVYASLGYMFNSAQAANPVAGGTVAAGVNQVGVMSGIQQRF